MAPWRLPAECEFQRVPPALAQIEPVICIVFNAFASLAILDGVDDDSILLRIRHLGGSKMQATLTAVMQRQLDLVFPHRYQVTLRDPGQFTACLAIGESVLAHKEAA